jgi:hypothetical protein
MYYSYPADGPPGAGSGDAGQRSQPGVRRMPFTCYRYPHSCFSYLDDVSAAAGKRDAVLPGLRRMPYSSCFRY